MLGTVTLLALALAAPGPDVTRTESAGLRYEVPRAWTRVPAPSDVRAAQYALPRATGDAEDGELILFFFGAGKGGGTDDNLKRWYGQFSEPDGRQPGDAAVVTIRTVKGLKVTAVDLPGTYLGMQGGAGAPPAPKAGFRMLGAIVEGDGGPWFFKAVGPAATMGQAKPAFDQLVESLEAHK